MVSQQQKNNAFGFFKTGIINEGLSIGIKLDLKKFNNHFFNAIGEATYIYYYSYEIGVLDKKIFSINLMWDVYNHINQTKINKGNTFQKVINTLNLHSIGWVFISKLTFDDQLAIRTEGNVDLLFEKTNYNKVILSKASMYNWHS